MVADLGAELVVQFSGHRLEGAANELLLHAQAWSF
jgi:hypothetical protein